MSLYELRIDGQMLASACGASDNSYIPTFWLLFQNMVASKQTSSTIMMSPGMTSAIFQEALMAHIIDLKSKAFNVITSGPQTNALPTKTVQKHLFYIDDLNTAAMENGRVFALTLYLIEATCLNPFTHI